MEFSDDLTYFKFTLRLLYDDTMEDLYLYAALEDDLFIHVLN